MSDSYWNQHTANAFEEVYLDPYGDLAIPQEHRQAAYQFGWDHALADEYPGETWEDVELDMERGWRESHQRHGEWAKMKAFVRHAWEKAKVNWRGLADESRQAKETKDQTDSQ